MLMDAQPPEPPRPPPRWWGPAFELKHSLWWCTAALPVLIALAALTAPAYSYSAPNPIYNLLLYAFCIDLIVVSVLAVKVWRRRHRSRLTS
jgi:hypothetical protein